VGSIAEGYGLVAGLWPEIRRSRMAVITSSAAASVARPQADVVGTGTGVGVGVPSKFGTGVGGASGTDAGTGVGGVPATTLIVTIAMLPA